MRIAIDAGHGLNTDGKRCLAAFDPEETPEWRLNDRVASYAATELRRMGFDVVRTDDVTGVQDRPVSLRAAAANRTGCDYFISIHHASGIGGRSGGGITVYTHPDPDPAALHLRNILYDSVIAETGLTGNRTEPLKYANFQVLREANMPAALIECGFMDSRTETPRVLSDSFARSVARGIVRAVRQLGQVPYIPVLTFTPSMARAAQKIQTKTGLGDQAIAYLMQSPHADQLIEKLADAMH